MKYPNLKAAIEWCIKHKIELPADFLDDLKTAGITIKALSRDQLEKKLSSLLGTSMRSQLENLMDAIGDPPDLSRLSEAFWLDAGKEMAVTIMPILKDAYIAQAESFVDEQGIDVDWALINIDAEQWARSYSFDMVSGLNDTSKTALQGLISDYFTNGMTIDELTNALSTYFGATRAEMIAVTEVTRASVQGELAAAEEIRKMNAELGIGLTLEPIWNTNNDELVCPICGPLNQTKKDVWGKEFPDGPPGHPNCRCWLNHDVVEND